MAYSIYTRVLCILLLILSTTVSASRRKKGKMDTTYVVKSFLYEELVPALSGYVAFSCTLGLSTCGQKMMGISTGTKFLARLAGIPSVCAASIVGHRCAVLAQEWSRNPPAMLDHQSSLWTLSTSSTMGDYYLIANRIRLPKQDVHTCLLGLAAFKLLGGRFWAIAPSSYTNPGSFARQSLPATYDSYIGGGSKNDQLQQMFNKWGCHTCGSKAGSAIGDHMPPKSIGAYMKRVNYRFYPQCGECSTHQGGLLRRATSKVNASWANSRTIRFLEASGGRSAAYNHGARLRINHLAGCLMSPRLIESDFAKELTTQFEHSKWRLKDIPNHWNSLRKRAKEVSNNGR